MCLIINFGRYSHKTHKFTFFTLFHFSNYLYLKSREFNFYVFK